MKTLKIQICDVWDEKESIVEKDYLFKLLKKKYKVELSSSPEIVFFSVFGNEHKKYLHQKKIFYTGENIAPNYNDCDFSLSFKRNSPVNIYFPNFIRHPYFQSFLNNELNDEIKNLRYKEKRNFCNFLYFNYNAKERIEFTKLLAKYKRIDAPGRVLNNMPALNNRGDWIAKIKFLSNYKFTIAFENEKSLNYSTEKIYHAFLAGSIPIYWGNPNVTRIFNPNSFINANDHNSFREVIKFVKYIDSNDQAYLKMINAFPFINNRETRRFQEQTILKRFSCFLESTKFNYLLRKISYTVKKKIIHDETY